MVYNEIFEELAYQIGYNNINKISFLLGLPIQSTIIIVAFFIIIIFIWSLIWKGLALWKSSKNNHKFWFILILLLNTLGILEIFYIYYFSKKFSKKNKIVKK